MAGSGTGKDRAGIKRGKPAKKYSQAVRLHDILRLLEVRRGVTVAELAEECQVTRRTVYRDLQAIETAGYPLLKETGMDGQAVYSLLTGFRRIPPITFSLNELMTLFLCRGQMAFVQGTPFQDDLDAVFGRIRSSLPPRSVAHLERLAEVVTPRFQGLRDYSGKRHVLEDLRRALLFQLRCLICYVPPQREPCEYLFDPYTLLFYKDSLYLGGYAHNRRGLRLFLLDRVQSVAIGEERFELPEDFSVEQLTGGAFGLVSDAPRRIQLQFEPVVAHLVRERLWHESQTLCEMEDGGVLLTLQVGGEKEILSWLYSFVPHVRVLEPKDLRERFVEGLRCALDLDKNV